MINNKMSLNDIHQVTASISNSLWTLRKSGELNHLTDEAFKQMYKIACKLDNDTSWAILHKSKENNNNE